MSNVQRYLRWWYFKNFIAYLTVFILKVNAKNYIIYILYFNKIILYFNKIIARN